MRSPPSYRAQLQTVASPGCSVFAGGTPRRDGIDTANHLSHYLLTRELLPIVKERIVQVSSAGQLPIDFDDSLQKRSYSGWQAYASRSSRRSCTRST